MNLNTFIQEYREEYSRVLEELDITKIDRLYRLLSKARKSKNTIYILGNGGSAASSSHWVCDFNKGANNSRNERIRMFSLTDNTPIMTAIGNDITYDDIFLEQLKNILNPGDIVVGFSVSGKSTNILKALEYANENQAETFSIIGNFSGEIGITSKQTLVVPSKNYGIVEDVHMYIGHVLSQYIKEYS